MSRGCPEAGRAVTLTVALLLGLGCWSQEPENAASASGIATEAPAVDRASAGEARGASADHDAAHRRVFFLGIDGANWRVMGPLLEAGELPNFARVMRQGASMQHFETMNSTDSPVVWTTMATGRLPADHGITDYVEILPDGKRIPISSTSRQTKAIWEVATEHEVSVGVAGWWASWPAEEVNGYVLTDHANPAYSEHLYLGQKYWTADTKNLAALEKDFYPLDLAPVLAQHWLEKATFDYGEMQRRGGFTAAQLEQMKAAPWNERQLYSILKTFYLVDYPFFAATHQLYREREADLTMLYLRGPDPIQHYGWDLVEPEKYARQPADLERDRGLIEGVYRYLDSWLGELLGELTANTWLVIASDHGAEPTRGAHLAGFDSRPGGHTTAAKGVLFIHGPEVQAGHQIQRGDPRDVMPTLAWLLGLPLSQELAGTPITEAFSADFVASRPASTIASYGPRNLGSTSTSGADDAMLESLKALGYIED